LNQDDRLLVALVAVMLVVGLLIAGYSIMVTAPRP